MSHKSHPLVFRLGVNEDWKSRWFSKKNYQEFLQQDILIRDFIFKKLTKAGIDKVEIERSANIVNIKVFAARPGLIIGRGGAGIEDLKKEIKKAIQKNKGPKSKIDVKVEIEEVRQPETHAMIMAQSIADQLEKRIPFRRVIKQTIEKINQNKDVKGVKIMVNGRLDGTDIARTEWLRKGKIPLQTLRSNIDFARATAFTTYGTVGIKVWIYKGEVF